MCKSILHIKTGAISTIGEFYGLPCDIEQNNERLQNEMVIEMGGRKEIIDTFGTDTTEWQEAQVRYGQLGENLETQIGLCVGLGGLGGKSNNRDEAREWNDGVKELKRRGIDRQLPRIDEDAEGNQSDIPVG